MVKTIYVGNLPPAATVEEVTALFSQHGKVASVKLVRDRDTGLPRGFGFVEMQDDCVEAAITALDGHEFAGNPLRVNEAHERGERQPRRPW